MQLSFLWDLPHTCRKSGETNGLRYNSSIAMATLQSVLVTRTSGVESNVFPLHWRRRFKGMLWGPFIDRLTQSKSGTLGQSTFDVLWTTNATNVSHFAKTSVIYFRWINFICLQTCIIAPVTSLIDKHIREDSQWVYLGHHWWLILCKGLL